MSYEQISESTYYQNMSYWNQVAQNYRALGGLGICDDETGEVIEEEPKPEPKSDKYVTTIKFWFDLEQAKQFKEWLDAHDVKFETMEGMKKC